MKTCRMWPPGRSLPVPGLHSATVPQSVVGGSSTLLWFYLLRISQQLESKVLQHEGLKFCVSFCNFVLDLLPGDKAAECKEVEFYGWEPTVVPTATPSAQSCFCLQPQITQLAAVALVMRCAASPTNACRFQKKGNHNQTRLVWTRISARLSFIPRPILNQCRESRTALSPAICPNRQRKQTKRGGACGRSARRLSQRRQLTWRWLPCPPLTSSPPQDEVTPTVKQ